MENLKGQDMQVSICTRTTAFSATNKRTMRRSKTNKNNKKTNKNNNKIHEEQEERMTQTRRTDKHKKLHTE